MRSELIILILFAVLIFPACDSKAAEESADDSAATGGVIVARSSEAAANDRQKVESEPEIHGGQPRSIRDFFMLLPEKYFVLEGCVKETDKDCRKAKIDYLKTFTEVEDVANGYLKGGCDGAQTCLEMAIFKRPSGSYLVGVATSAEMMNDYYFLDYAGGKWNDVSSDVVPQFSKKNMYELPRKGTTVRVFAKTIIEKGDDYEISEKGEKLYDLEWKNGKFAVKK